MQREQLQKIVSDWEYVSRARNGDENATQIIYKKYNKILIRMTALITGSIDSAKDIVQESFIRLLSKKSKHQDGSFKTYITTIAYRLALKEKYRMKRNNSVNNKDFQETTSLPDEIQIEKETQENIFQAIFSLPQNQRQILVLRFYAGCSYEEISEIAQVPIGTVKSRIFYGVKTCRDILKKKGVFE